MNGSTASPASGDLSTHRIAQVPYVSQETDFFCAFASTTMVFQYYGKSVNLSDILFYSGAGYALIYSTPLLPRLPVGCIGAAKWTQDRSFVGSLFGLSYDNWVADDQLSESVKWEHYWQRLKENVSQDKPVITNLNPLFLPSMKQAIRLEMDKQETMLTPVEDWVWEHLPVGLYHAIVIVGYNEDNKTVCLHDPAAGIYGHPEAGTYCWMPLQKFRQAIYDLSKINPQLSYSIELFSTTGSPELPHCQRLTQGIERNMDKLRGCPEVYDTHIKENWSCSEFGIDVVAAMQNDYTPGFSRLSTSFIYQWLMMYHLYPFQYLIFSLLDERYPTVFGIDDHLNTVNHIRQIGMEKKLIATYLQQESQITPNITMKRTLENQSRILFNESTHWYEIGRQYTEFIRKGVIIPMPKSLRILEEMQKQINEILVLEDEILSLQL